MRLTLIRADNWISIDGRGLTVDLSDLPEDLHALQWYETQGEIERPGLMNQPINSLTAFQTYIDRWNAAADAIDNPPAPPAPTLEEIQRAYLVEIQKHLDAAAQACGYDNIVSACSYAGYANVFRDEAISFGVWRADVWAYCYTELAKVKAATRALPTIEQILSELPARVLP